MVSLGAQVSVVVSWMASHSQSKVTRAVLIELSAPLSERTKPFSSRGTFDPIRCGRNMSPPPVQTASLITWMASSSYSS
eukprot:417579-Prymnesium_polylepis.1